MTPPTSFPLSINAGPHYQLQLGDERDPFSGLGATAEVRSKNLLRLTSGLHLDLGVTGSGTFADTRRFTASPEVILDLRPKSWKGFGATAALSPIGLDLREGNGASGNVAARAGLDYRRFVGFQVGYDRNVVGEPNTPGALTFTLTTDLLRTGPALIKGAGSLLADAPEEGAPVTREPVIDQKQVDVQELIPDHNVRGTGRENLVFVKVVFVDRDGEPVSPVFEDETYEDLVRKIVDFGGKGFEDGKKTRHGIFGHEPFVGQENRFNFWIVTHRIPLERSKSSMCMAAGPELGRMNEELAQKTGLDNLQFINLLTTDCRSQASWFDFSGASKLQENFLSIIDWGSLVEKLTNQETLAALQADSSEIYRLIERSANLKEFAKRLFKPLPGPTANLSLDVAEGDIKIPDRVVTVAVHEFGHSFGHLWDLYVEAGTESFSGRLKELNREISLGEILRKHVGFSLPALDKVKFNLFKLVMRHPAIAEVIGEPIGYPHCAIDQKEAREWWADFKGQGTGEQRVTFDELGWNQGCLYMDDQFYRSSKRSRMRDSNSPDASFDPVEQDQIQKRLDAIATRMTRADCGCEKD